MKKTTTKYTHKFKGTGFLALDTTEKSVKFLLIFVFIILAIGTYNKIDAFYHQTNDPIPYSPIFNIPAEQQPETIQHHEFPKDFKYHDIFLGIRFNESTLGTNPKGLHITCREQGKYNEIGYAASVQHCFDNEEQAYTKIKTWFDIRFNNGYTLAQALCEYNTGNPSDNCKYYQDYAEFIGIQTEVTL